MLTFDVRFSFGSPGYIAHPYWPEMDRLINVQKESGLNRARSQANRRKALEEYLKSIGMTLAAYEQLVERANRPFHTDSSGLIIIPAEKVAAFLVSVTDQVRAAFRPCPPDQVRTRIIATDFITTKSEPDGVWERYAVVESGTGQKLSNQRGLRRSSYIRDFEAEGTLSVNPDFVKPDVLRQALAWGGENVGIGAARKMGWGRFQLARWEQVSSSLAVAAE